MEINNFESNAVKTMYISYLSNHINNVKIGFHWLEEYLSNIFDDTFFNEYMNDMNDEYQIESLDVQIQEHDSSKWMIDEMIPYANYFYGHNQYEYYNEFNYAWALHIHRNPHHWQYWILIEDDPKSTNNQILLKMPYNYIIEMICDWWAFSWNDDDLTEIFLWYNEHKANMKMHPQTQAMVEKILNLLNDKLSTFPLDDIIDKDYTWNKPISTGLPLIDFSKSEKEEE